MNKHTPGPWKFSRPLKVGGFKSDGYQIFDDTHGLIAEIPTGTSHDLEEVQANARLIAAAPELLMALKKLHGNHQGSSAQEICAVCNLIARAEGRAA